MTSDPDPGPAERLLALHRAAPVDDEPDDDPGELEPAREQLRRGLSVPLEQARHEFDITGAGEES